MNVSDKEVCTPQKEEGIEEVIWVDVDSVLQKIDYLNIKEVIERAISLIKK